MTGRLPVVYLLAVLAAAASALAAETLRILPVVRGDDVVVSFELADAYNDEIRQAISSGLRTTFTYDVELRMVVPTWVDRTVVTTVVTSSDEYDNLTRRHKLSRSLDGRVQEVTDTEDESLVRKWLTTFSGLPLCRTAKLDRSRDYYVRISARARPHGGSLLGWTNAVTGQARFTFAP
jgi:uncharacterized protein DUF4390